MSRFLSTPCFETGTFFPLSHSTISTNHALCLTSNLPLTSFMSSRIGMASPEVLVVRCNLPRWPNRLRIQYNLPDCDSRAPHVSRSHGAFELLNLQLLPFLEVPSISYQRQGLPPILTRRRSTQCYNCSHTVFFYRKRHVWKVVQANRPSDCTVQKFRQHPWNYCG